MRLASQVSWNAAPSPSKDQGRSTVATLMLCFVGAAEKPFLHRAVGRPVEDLDGALARSARRRPRVATTDGSRPTSGTPGFRSSSFSISCLFCVRRGYGASVNER